MNNPSIIFKINPWERKILEIIADCAKELHTECFAVGGYVRDRIIDPHKKLLMPPEI